MQQSPYFKNMLSPEDTSKFFPSLQRFNNGICSPRTLFFGLNLNSSGQNSYKKKYILSKMKFSSSGGKIFLSNKSKRNYSSESIEKNNKKKIINNYSKTNDNNVSTTVFINDTKASSKKNSTYPIPNTYTQGIGIGGGVENHFNYNYYHYNNYYNQGKSNSSFVNYNKSAYIGSVKKNLLPCLSNELKSNSKNKINKNKKLSCSKSNISSSNKKTTNESIAYEHLCKTAESLDLEKMVDYIVSSTKIYNRYNDNKENICNNSFNNLINKNDIRDTIYNNSNEKKSGKKIKKNVTSSNKKCLINYDVQKNTYSLCKCKKVECLKYSCSCLKSGNKCSNLCSCMNCKNKESNIFKVDY
jgi:hypothetical protein